MRILVTGGTGFIGSALVLHLVRETGADVLNIDKLTYCANPASLEPVAGASNYRFLKGDICDGPLLRDALDSFRPECIIHLAAESHVDRSIDGAAPFIATNINGTFTLLEATRQYWAGLSSADRAAFRFLHVSTDEVYGSLGPTGTFRETSPYDPSSPYSASKAASDHLVTAWGRTYGLPVILSNCSNNYGPRQFPEKLIPLIILNALRGKALPVYGNGQNIRDWLHVEDHVKALTLIAARGQIGAHYVVGSRNEQRNIDIVRAICAAMDRLKPQGAPFSRLIEHVTDRPGHDVRYAVDPARLETELGWKAGRSFAAGLADTILWYMRNEHWWRPLLMRPELAGTGHLS